MSAWFVAAILLSQPTASPRDVFQRAEELYQQEHYTEAVQEYETLRSQGIRDGVLYYNLGNAYFKSGQLGPAILNYERALRQMPGDEDARANLAYANELIVDVVQKPSLPGYVAWAVRLYEQLSPDFCAALLSICFLVGGVATSLLIVGVWPRLKTPAVYTLVAAGLITILSATVLTAKVQSSGESEEAIVLVQETDVRSGPGESNPQLAEIHEGLKVAVLGAREGWLQVSLPTGLTGWVRQSDAEII
jgi:tetratricopeptide (TPR) repeat protein